ncbi:sensor histidine kinase [Marinobacterium sp. D7]|uniref:sensor histidine kinase n=1 Tax=Marinobacterium ramblicola TaxID=2849041 RepID=UPI001C2CC7EA|nr:sensor histidine kinase [Marinobacterium ramblicola]MBV1786438.1 sensor histidine kinase [Marinobacterium ramblicola]
MTLSTVVPAKAAVPLVLGQERISLDHGQLSLLEDPGHTLDWQQALAAQRAGAFRDIPHGVGEGYSRSAFWVHVDLERDAGVTDDWAFIVGPAYLDRVDFYLLRDDTLLDRFSAGDLIEDPEHDRHHRLHIVGSRIPEGRSELLIRLQTSSTSVLLVQALPGAKVEAAIGGRLLSEGVMTGILLMVLVINLLNGIWLRRMLFIYFVVYEACLLITTLLISGLMREFFPGLGAHEQNLLMQFGVLGSGVLAFIFFREMLAFPFRGNWWVYLLFWIGIGLALVGGYYALQDEYVRAMAYINVYVTLFPLVVSVPLLLGWRAFNAEQKFRAGGCLVFGLFVSVNSLYTIGMVPVTLGSTFIAPVMILSFQLCLHFIIMFSVRKSERTLLDMQRRAELSGREAGLERSLRRAHETFLAMFAHEVRTPMAVIDTAVQSLGVLERKENAREQRQQRYRRIRDAIKRIDQLLQLSLVRGRQEIDPSSEPGEPYDVSGVVLKVMSEFEPAQRKRISFALPPARVTFISRLSEPMLGVVLRNLIDNALKYSPAEELVEVNVWADRQRIGLSVRDYGEGMSDYAKQRMFERFYRAREREDVPGLGLGLFVVKEVVDRYSGRVEVETGAEGTCITCYFTEARL